MAKSIVHALSAMSGEPYIIPRHPDFWDDNTQADMISLFRPIIDLNTNAVLGVVEIQMLFRQIELICNSQDLDEATALLFAPDDELVYSSTYYDMISPRRHMPDIWAATSGKSCVHKTRTALKRN